MVEKLSIKTKSAPEDLKKNIVQRYKSELKEDGAKKIASMEEMFREDAAKKAAKILINTMQRLSLPTSVETRAVLVKVPKDQIKGKIVGKEAKNIEAFEELLDVAVVFNDLPNTISISAFNLVTRRIAEKAIKKTHQKKRWNFERSGAKNNKRSRKRRRIIWNREKSPRKDGNQNQQQRLHQGGGKASI